MPTVKKWRPATYNEREYYHRDQHYDYVRKPWKELTRGQMLKAVAIRATALFTVGGSLFISWPEGPVDSWGDLPRAAKRADQVEQVRERAANMYAAQSIAGKYALMYLAPGHVEATGEVEGSGFLGWIGSDGKELNINVGQICLAGSAYDTQASMITGRASGELSAVASLAVEGESVSVHPAGSNAPALEFTLDESGMLVADAQTAGTLQAYGCEVGLGLYEEIGFNDFRPLEG